MGPAIVIATLLHAQVMVTMGVLAYWKAPRDAGRAREEAIDITALSEAETRDALAERERREDEEEKRAEEEKKKDEEKPTPDRQVVDIPRPRREAAPREARYAAEHDSSVEKETHRRGPPDRREAPQPEQPNMLAMRSPRPSRAPGVMGAPGLPVPPRPAGQDPETESFPQPGAAAAPGGPPDKPTPPPSPSLMPSQQTLSRALGSGSSDYLRDVDEGDDTALNAKKWKFASFFNRVKEQIRQHWHASEEYSKRDPTGTLYGGKLRFTVLIVELDPSGRLAAVRLEKPSGVDFLDDIAVEAVKEAQPFPNPPQQLVDKAVGRINFRFGFVVDVEGATRLKMFRYSSM